MSNSKNGMTGIWFDFKPPTPSHIDGIARDDTIGGLQDLLIHLDSRITWSQDSLRTIQQRPGTLPPFVRVSISAVGIESIVKSPAAHLEEIADEFFRSIAIERTSGLLEMSEHVKDDIFRVKEVHVIVDGKTEGRITPTRKKKAV